MKSQKLSYPKKYFESSSPRGARKIAYTKSWVLSIDQGAKSLFNQTVMAKTTKRKSVNLYQKRIRMKKEKCEVANCMQIYAEEKVMFFRHQ